MFRSDSCERDLLLLSPSSSESPLLVLTIGSETRVTVLGLDSPLVEQVEVAVVDVVGAGSVSPKSCCGWWRRDSASVLLGGTDDFPSARPSVFAPSIRACAPASNLAFDRSLLFINFMRHRETRSDSICIANRLASSLEYPVISRLLTIPVTLEGSNLDFATIWSTSTMTAIYDIEDTEWTLTLLGYKLLSIK